MKLIQSVIIGKVEKTSICDQYYICLARMLTFFLFFTVYPFEGGMKEYKEHIPLIFKFLTIS